MAMRQMGQRWWAVPILLGLWLFAGQGWSESGFASWVADRLGLAQLRATEPVAPVVSQVGVSPELDAEGGGEISSRPSRAAIAEMRRDLAAILEAGGVPGLGLALVDRRGLIWSGGVGWADVAGQKPVDASTVFRFGSVSKSFVALAALRAVDEGRLDLNRPVTHYASDLGIDNPWQRTQPVTTAHLLEHTAGFDDMHFNEYGDASTPWQLTPKAALAINPRSRQLRWPPGTHFAYANPGTTVTARVLEVVSQLEFDALMARDVFAPLNIEQAGFYPNAALSRQLARGYGADLDHPLRDHAIAHRAAGQLYATPAEVARMVQMMLRQGRVGEGQAWPRAAIERMGQSLTRVHQIEGLSYGLATYGHPLHPVANRGHGGGLPGFRSDYRYFPTLGVGYVLAFNSHEVGGVERAVADRVFATLTGGKEFAPPARPSYTPEPHELEALVGSYSFANPRHSLFAFIERLALGCEISVVEGRVFIEFGLLGRVELEPVGPHLFRSPGARLADVRYFPDTGHFTVFDLEFQPTWSGGGLWTARWFGVVSKSLVYGFILGLAYLVFGRRFLPVSVDMGRLDVVPHTLACGSLLALPMVFAGCMERGLAGSLNPWSFAFWLGTLIAAAASGWSLVAGLRQLREPWPWYLRPWGFWWGLCCFSIIVWLEFNDIIGLRTWAY